MRDRGVTELMRGQPEPDPCVTFDPEAYKRSPMLGSPVLEFASTEVTLPLSPHQLLILSLVGHRGSVRSRSSEDRR